MLGLLAAAFVGGGLLVGWLVVSSSVAPGCGLDVQRLQLSRVRERALIHWAKRGAFPSTLRELFAGEPTPRDLWGSELSLARGADGRPGVRSFGPDRLEGGADDVTVWWDAPERSQDGLTPPASSATTPAARR